MENFIEKMVQLLNVEFAGGTKEWWINEKLHREDGPTIEFANGDKKWYLNGISYLHI